MKKLKISLKKLFCLSPLLTVCLSAFGFGFVLTVAIFDIQNPVLRYASYIASACVLVISITGLCYVGPAVNKLKNFALNHRLPKNSYQRGSVKNI